MAELAGEDREFARWLAAFHEELTELEVDPSARVVLVEQLMRAWVRTHATASVWPVLPTPRSAASRILDRQAAARRQLGWPFLVLSCLIGTSAGGWAAWQIFYDDALSGLFFPLGVDTLWVAITIDVLAICAIVVAVLLAAGLSVRDRARQFVPRFAIALVVATIIATPAISLLGWWLDYSTSAVVLAAETGAGVAFVASALVTAREWNLRSPLSDVRLLDLPA